MSTKEAQLILTNYQWILKMNHGDIRIVTDMVRKENGKMVYDAGIDLVKLLRKKYKFNHKLMIFCGDVKKAKQKCLDADTTMAVYVTASSKALRSFINFEPNVDEKYLVQSK